MLQISESRLMQQKFVMGTNSPGECGFRLIAQVFLWRNTFSCACFGIKWINRYIFVHREVSFSPGTLNSAPLLFRLPYVFHDFRDRPEGLLILTNEI